MPKAVVTVDFDRYELESCPGGFIELRPLSYGDKLERDGMSLKMSTQMEAQGNRKQRRAGQKAGGVIDYKMSNKEVTLFEYQHMTGEHNLEDANGNKLDLKSIQGISQLDPKVGGEIGELIADINDFDSEGKSE